MDKNIIYKSAYVKKNEDTAIRGVYSIWASTNEIDAQEDLMEPGSFYNLEAYLKSYPRILYNHSWINYNAREEETLPIGKAVNGQIIPERGLRIDFIFSELPFASKVKYIVDNDFPLFASIGGFIEDSIPDKVEGREVQRIKKFKLVEISLTAVQANEGAAFIKQLKAAGMATQNIEKTLAEIFEYGKAKAVLSEKDKMLGLANFYLKKTGG